MANVVNIFLGGTGKQIAGLIRARSLMYNAAHAPMLVFDTDPVDLQSRSARLGRDLRTPGAAFGDSLHDTLEAWNRVDRKAIQKQIAAGGPEFDTAVAPYKAAKMLLPVSRAAGGGLWTLRAHGHLALGCYLQLDEQQVHFLGDVVSEIARQADDDEDVRVNIVASIAGGTGSGVFLPIALKLSEMLQGRGHGIKTNVCLYLVLPSAFYNDWKQGTGDVSTITRTRGLTGAFAAWQELQFLYGRDDNRIVNEPGVKFRVRTMPLLPDRSQTVNYSSSNAPVQRVYWAGMRTRDKNATSGSLFDEVARVLATISDPAIDQKFEGHAAVGTSAAKLTWSAACIEYPLLELAQKYSALAVANALSELDGGSDGLLDADLYYREFVNKGNAERPLSRFVDAERQGVFADKKDVKSALAQPEHVGALLEEGGPKAAEAFGFATLGPQPIGSAHQGGDATGYSGDGPAWEQKAIQQHQNLDVALRQNVESAKRAMVRWLEREAAAVNAWLAADVVPAKLNAGESIQQVLNTIGAHDVPHTLQGELQRVREFFSREFSNVVSDAALEDRYKGAEYCERLYDQRKQDLIDPPPEGRMNTALRWLIILLISGAAGWGVWSAQRGLELGDTTPAVGAIVLVLVAAFILYKLTERELPIEKRREHAEQRLFEAHRELVLARCGEQLWGKNGVACEKLLNPLLGIEGASELRDGTIVEIKGSLDQTKDVLGRFGTVCRRAGDESAALGNRELVKPPDVAVWLGDTLAPTPSMRDTHVRLVRKQLQIEGVAGGEAGTLSDVNIQLGAVGTGKNFSLGNLLRALGEKVDERDKARWLDFFDTLQERAWTLVSGELGLPESLHDWLLRDAGNNQGEVLRRLANHLITLAETQRARGAPIASAVSVPASSPSLLVVKNPAMQSLVGQALAHPDLIDRPNERAILRAGLEGGENGQPHVSRTAGEAILLLSMYDVPSIAKVLDIDSSRDQYYSANQQVDLAVPPTRYCAANCEFHLLPEVSAAATIEAKQRRGQPLHALLVPHLLGSDPALPGPTTITLFYLARQQGQLVREAFNSDDDEPTYRWSLVADGRTDGDTWPLLIETVSHEIPNDPATKLGRVRLLDPFDAFQEFLRYRGMFPNEQTVCQLNSHSTICVQEWFRRASSLEQRQQSVRLLWSGLSGDSGSVVSKRRTCFQEMRDLLRQDAQLLPGGDDPAGLRRSWVDAAEANFAAAEERLQGIGDGATSNGRVAPGVVTA